MFVVMLRDVVETLLGREPDLVVVDLLADLVHHPLVQQQHLAPLFLQLLGHEVLVVQVQLVGSVESL